MRWKHTLCIVVVVLILVFGARTVLHISRNSSEVVPVSVDITQPFYAVYFACPDGTFLIPEFSQGPGTIEERLKTLLAGPRLPNHSPVIPQDVRLLGYNLRGDVLFVDFSHQLITNHPGGSAGEIITVYGIVNTLIGAEGVQRVQILVEGRPILTLAGHLDLAEPLAKDYELLDSSHI